jgi:hypothetical protein
VPADCEIDECGVAAIGRCGRCWQAFCGSHQATRNTGEPLVDRCRVCRPPASYQPSQYQQHLQAIGGVEQRLRDMLEQLHAAGRPGAEPLVQWDHSRSLVFVKWKQAPTGKLGWRVGTRRWGRDLAGERSSDDYADTFVTTDGQLFKACDLDDTHRGWSPEASNRKLGGKSTVNGFAPHRLTELTAVVETLERFLA